MGIEGPITFHGFRFEVLRRQRNKILALRLTRLG